MQAVNFRYLVLTAVLLAGAGLYAAFGDSPTTGDPRWPAATATFLVDNWITGPQVLGKRENQTQEITRVFRNSHGQSAVLTIFSQRVPKLYGPGAEVPFLGNGYTVEPGIADESKLVDIRPADQSTIGSLVARRGEERWLVMYAYGERRGLLGNGPVAWTLAAADGILGRPNDYYKMYLAARIDLATPEFETSVAALARTVFARVSAWYSA